MTVLPSRVFGHGKHLEAHLLNHRIKRAFSSTGLHRRSRHNWSSAINTSNAVLRELPLRWPVYVLNPHWISIIINLHNELTYWWQRIDCTKLISLIQNFNWYLWGQLIISRKHMLNLFVYNIGWNLLPGRKFVISRPVRQALLDLVQQALLDLVQQALLDLKQYRGITIEKKKIMWTKFISACASIL